MLFFRIASGRAAASQRRALSRIERKLADDHPGLLPLYAIFNGLTAHEAMPVTERVTAQPRRLPWQRRMWPTVAGLVGLAMITVTLFTLSLTLPSRPMCAGTTISIAARMQAIPPGNQAACSVRPSKPPATGPSAPHTP